MFVVGHGVLAQTHPNVWLHAHIGTTFRQFDPAVWIGQQGMLWALPKRFKQRIEPRANAVRAGELWKIQQVRIEPMPNTV